MNLKSKLFDYQSFAKLFLLGSVFVFPYDFYAQTVTDIFPTRVTRESIITVIGSGFNNTTRNNMSLSGISITSKTLVSSTEMTFEINTTGSSDINNALFTISGVTFNSSVDDTFDYIAPISKELRNTEPFFVEEIYTNWDWDGSGFWRSNDWDSNNQNTWPNDKHELLGFKMEDGTTYSTGIENDLLLSGLGFNPLAPPTPLPYEETRYKAYSTNGVQGRTNSAHYILTGDLVDGFVGSAENATDNNLSSLTEISGTTIFDVIIDGRNGLELGTGISNFNNNTSVRFFSGNGVPGVIGDSQPDLLITQIAQAGGTDTYYYADNRGNVVGTPIRIKIPNSSSTRLAQWRLDLFSFPGGQPFESTNPNRRGFTGNDNETRPIRMLAFRLEDFNIDANPSGVNYIENIDNVNMLAGGTADLAFLAYNAGTFDIKSPLADPLLSQFVCVADGSSSNTTFTVTAGVDDGNGNLVSPNPTATPSEILNYEWSKFNFPISGETNSAYTITGVGSSDLATYKVKVSNANGTVILPVTLSEGGTPTFWNGSVWTSPFGAVADRDRNLVFSSDYNESGDIEGCDCVVASGSNVTIEAGNKLVLYDELIIQPEIPEDLSEGISFVAAGTLTLENNASLIQTKPILSADNINEGNIIYKRTATNLANSDYVYWSSPVDNFDIGNISGNNTFRWNTLQANPAPNNTHGNWATVANSHEMELGIGYIKRVPNGSSEIYSDFIGRPRNGTITVDLMQTPSPTSTLLSDRNWNLIGNPYPSAISAAKFLLRNAEDSAVGDEIIEGAVHLWTHGTQISALPPDPFYDDFGQNYDTNDYVTWNIFGGNSPDVFAGNIAAGQGFFVKALNNSNPTAVTFTNLMRFNDPLDAGDTDPILNNQFFRMVDVSGDVVPTFEKQKIWLTLSNEDNLASNILIGYAEGATMEKDNLFDARSNNSAFGIYSLINDDKMVIQARPLPFDNTDQVPLGIVLNENGIFNISINQVKGNLFLDENQDIFIEDTYLNLIHDLRQSPYTFTEDAGEYNDRFLLRFTGETLSAASNKISNTFVFIKDEVLKVRSNKQINTIEVFNLSGKRLFRHYLMGEMEMDKDFNFSNGIYLASVLFNDGSVLNKKIVK
ncbi:MAG: hypothetical protein AAF688_01745 [Bacteroidota bacterium]